MAYKGEMSAATLNVEYKNLAEGDIVRVIAEGKIGSTLPELGKFVRKTSDGLEVLQGVQFVTNIESEQATSDLIDRETRGSNVTLTMPHDQNFYKVGEFYKYEDRIYECLVIAGDGEGNDTVTLYPFKGIVDITNTLKENIIGVYQRPHEPPTTDQLSLPNTYHVGDFIVYPVTRGDMVLPYIAEITSDDGADPADPDSSNLYTVRTASGVVEALQSLAARVYTLENA